MGNVNKDAAQLPAPPSVEIISAPHTLEEYEAKYKNASVRPEYAASLKSICGKILSHKDQYEKVEAATGVPWFVVACIHEKEASLNFGTHLHNGDSLMARTYHVPKGRPLKGDPPFAWYESAIDALGGVGAHKSEKWTLGYCLQYMEIYNGLGYRRRGMPTPYLWSFTDQYTKGLYVADGVFDSNAVSKNPGCAALMKTLGIFT